MKVNILVPTRSGGRFAANVPHSSVTGEKEIGPYSPEDALIESIDEQDMTDEKLVATRFLKFLSTRNISVLDLNKLALAEQNRIKKEFIDQ